MPWKESGPNVGTYNRGPTGAPTTPGAQALPVDPAYDAAVNVANRNRDTRLMGLQFERGQLGAMYGFGVDAQGSVFDDPSNPYSRAAALQAAYDRHTKGNTTSFAARGQLYSGALQNEQNDAAHKYGANRDTLIRDFLRANNAITSGQAQAQTAWQGDIAGAEEARVSRALANRDAVVAAEQPVKPISVLPRSKPKVRKPRK